MENKIIEAIIEKRVIQINYENHEMLISPVIFGVLGEEKNVLAFVVDSLDGQLLKNSIDIDSESHLTLLNFSKIEVMTMSNTFHFVCSIDIKAILNRFNPVIEYYH